MRRLFYLSFLLLLSACSLTENDLPSFSAQFLNNPSNHKTILDTLPNGVVFERIDSLCIFQDDMVFTENTINRLAGNNRSGIYNDAHYYWPGRIVYYTFHSNMSADDTTMVKLAMQEIASNTSISFQHATSSTVNYILFKSSNKSNSYVGMKGGEQVINLFSSFSKGTAMHEILHSLGLYHEHSRADRDNYIIINWNNIQLLKRHNYNIYSSGRDVSTFDFNSIMLYSSYNTSAINTTLPTMTRLDGSAFYAQRDYLSTGDLAGISSIYGPPFHRMEISTLNVLQEYEDDITDIYEVEKKAVIYFYSDASCTTLQALSYPRDICLSVYRETCNQFNNHSYGATYPCIHVEAGVDSVLVDTYTNYEYYYYSSPYTMDVTYYGIVNWHLPQVGDYH